MRSATKAKRATAAVRREYRKFILAQPCVACQISERFMMRSVQATLTEGAHVGPSGRATEGNSGAGKSSDFRMLPLCSDHHRSFHLISKSFWVMYGLDPETIINDLNERFDRGERAA
jgi:hypothetical protein